MRDPADSAFRSAVLRPAHLALSFLTAFPLPHVRQVREGDFARASGFYPLAGWAVGGLAAALLWLPLPIPAGVHAALVLSAWLAATGLLHFDGLVDCADAVFTMKSPEKRRAILKDVHVGAFGLATGALALFTLWSLLQSARPLDALTAAVAARAALLLPMRLFPAIEAGSLGGQARAGGGGALRVALLLTAPLLLLPLLWPPLSWPHLLAALLASLAASLAASRFCASRLGGVNGDVYGACITLAEMSALLALQWGR